MLFMLNSFEIKMKKYMHCFFLNFRLKYENYLLILYKFRVFKLFNSQQLKLLLSYIFCFFNAENGIFFKQYIC